MPLDHLGVSGTAATIDPPFFVNSTADYSGPFPAASTYTVLGFDRFNNPLGDITASSVLSGATCVLATCGGDPPGTYLITATDGTVHGTTSLVVAPYSATTMTCRGQNYDVDGTFSNGCEVFTPNTATTQGTASSLGSQSCSDGASAFTRTGTLPSDVRLHTNPAVSGFNAATGSTPIWYRMFDTGGVCFNDYSVTLQLSGSSAPTCYQLTVITDKGTATGNTTGTGTVTLTQGSGAYSDNTTVYFGITKTCNLPGNDDPNFTLNGHL